MKRLVLALFLFAMCTSPSLASSTEKVRFQNTSFGESLVQFTKKLSKYKVVDQGSDYVALSGKVGNKQATINGFFTPSSKKLYLVSVGFPSSATTFSSLEANFQEISEIFSKKYGSPDGKLRQYSYPYEEGDGHELTALQVGKLLYANIWHLSDGKITCGMFSNSSNELEVIVYYNSATMDGLREKEEAAALDADL